MARTSSPAGPWPQPFVEQPAGPGQNNAADDARQHVKGGVKISHCGGEKGDH